jgi:N-acetyl-gamma-glutamyl-phosphate reductase
MQKYSGLKNPPLFIPVVSNYYKGMITVIPLYLKLLNKKMNPADLQKFISDYYENEYFVKVMPFNKDENLDSGYLNAIEANDTNKIEIFVFGNVDQALVVSRLDNLGKGSSGAALQCMNIMLGLDERTGLEN